MKKFDQSGIVNPLVIPLITITMLLFLVGVFAIYAESQASHYKNNDNQLITAAVTQAEAQTKTTDATNYDELAKSPLNSYVGPQPYGSVTVHYPKTWSGYVDDTGSGQALVDGYFEPGIVPSINAQSSVFALRVQVQPASYDQVLQQNEGGATTGAITVSAYALPKVPSDVGVLLTGAIQPNIQGEMIILPLRSETLVVWTESMSYVPDFNNFILPNLSFSP